MFRSTWPQIGRFIGTSLVLGCCLGQAKAQDGAGWKVVCGSVDRCTALVSLKNTETNARFAAIGLQIGKGGKEPAMIAFLPLGVELKPGFRAVVGGTAYDAQFEACFADGCRAVAPLPDGALDKWLSAEKVELQFFPFGADKPVSAAVPLTGLREALQEHGLLSAP